MKEIVAIIRMDKVNQTKEALLQLGFPSMTCKKVMGRGKKKVIYELFHYSAEEQNLMTPAIAEQLSEEHRLMPKRMLTFVVDDKDVSKIVETIIKVNSNGNSGNGKIFVSTIEDAVRVRTGESGVEAIY